MIFGAHKPEEINSYFMNGGTISHLYKYESKQLSTMHHYALQLMRDGDYRGARNLFQLLVVCEHTHPEYQLGFGVCHQLTGDHHSAVLFLAQAAQILETDPRPHWLMARSAMALKQYDDAIELLNNTIALAGNKSKWEQITCSAVSEIRKCNELKETMK